MRSITVHLEETEDGRTSNISYIVEELRGTIWNRKETIDVTIGQPGANRKFLLQPNERLVIATLESQPMLLDADQFAVKHDLARAAAQTSNPPAETSTSTAIDKTPLTPARTSTSAPTKPAATQSDNKFAAQANKPAATPPADNKAAQSSSDGAKSSTDVKEGEGSKK